MLEDARPALEATLGGLAGRPYEAVLATNSFRFYWDADEDMPRGRRYLWIDPPWRLVRGDAWVTGSYDCPRWQDFVEEDDPDERDEEGRASYRRAFGEWGGLFNFLEKSPIVEFRVAPILPDLTIRFGCGRRIETFGTDTFDVWWYYADMVALENLEATSSGVVRHARAEGRPDSPNPT